MDAGLLELEKKVSSIEKKSNLSRRLLRFPVVLKIFSSLFLNRRVTHMHKTASGLVLYFT